MNCSDARLQLSARIDGEAPADDPGVDTHLARCAACRQWLQEAHEVTRLVRVSEAPRSVDLVERVLQQAQPRPARSPRLSLHVLRVGLAILGLAALALAVRPLLGDSHDSHVTQEVGAWDLAFAVALITAAVSPRRAAGLIPLAAVLVAGMAIVTVRDVVNDRVSVAEEGPHALAAASLLVLWLLDRRAARHGEPTPPRSGVVHDEHSADEAAITPTLRSVDDGPGRVTGAA